MPTSARADKVEGLSLMRSIRMDIDFIDAPMQIYFIVNAKKLVNVRHFEITATLQVS